MPSPLTATDFSCQELGRDARTMHRAGCKAHIHRLKSDLLEFGLFLVCIWPNSGCGLFLSLQCWTLYHINGFVAILILTRRINFQGRGSCCTLDVRFCRIKVWFSRLLFSFSFFFGSRCYSSLTCFIFFHIFLALSSLIACFVFFQYFLFCFANFYNIFIIGCLDKTLVPSRMFDTNYEY